MDRKQVIDNIKRVGETSLPLGSSLLLYGSQARDVAFRFHQTGARFIKDGKMYRIRRCYQLSQAHKANIDYKIGKYLVPETIKFEWKDSDYHD